jgi:ATP-dependent DNA helicase RecG
VLPATFDPLAPESANLERKESWKSADKIREAACAFANDFRGSNEPSFIVVGLRNDGSCAGTAINDELLTRLGEIRADGTLAPPPRIEIDETMANGCHLAVITVHPSLSPPVRFRGRVWIRVGPRNQLASPEEEKVLSERRRAFDLPFDYHPVPDAGLDDLRLDAIREYVVAVVSADVLAQNGRPVTAQLQSLRLIDPSGHPTYGSIIGFGIDTERFVPGAFLQFVRFDGASLDAPIQDEKRLSGALDVVIPILDDVLKANITTAVKITGELVERRRPTYPITALRQVVFNAVMHRNYESSNAPIRIYWFNDRIEVHSPGRLYGQVNEANFGTGVTDYRNPLVAEIMRGLGYVQRFGIGIPITRSEMQRNGNPDPEFAFSESAVLVILRPAH